MLFKTSPREYLSPDFLISQICKQDKKSWSRRNVFFAILASVSSTRVKKKTHRDSFDLKHPWKNNNKQLLSTLILPYNHVGLNNRVGWKKAERFINM